MCATKKGNESNHKFYSGVNFEGTLTPKKIQKFPLDEKLSYLFACCMAGDLIAVGKNFEEVYKGISDIITNFGTAIRNIFYIQNNKLTVPLVFNIDDNTDDNWLCTNIGNKNILITKPENTLDFEPKTASELTNGAVIINDKMNIPINYFPDYEKYCDDEADINLITNPSVISTVTLNLKPYQAEWAKIANTEALKNIDVDTIKNLIANSVPTTETKAETVTENTMEKIPAKNRKLSFADVGGMDKTIDLLKRNILYPIKYPFAYKNMSLNRGILLYGKPGTGKTLIAEALAGECDAEFIKISGTDLESKWVGETEENWRKIFAQAIEKQPSVIFIDEFDAVVKERGHSSSDHADKVVNQLLSLMSDLEKGDNNVFVIATTNKPDSIDPAIKRSGRFGKQIEIPEPDKNALKSIFDIHTKNKKLDDEVNVDNFIDQFYSRKFTGADIKHIVNEASEQSWVRNNVYEKMDDGTLTEDFIDSIKINNKDFETALLSWDKTQTVKPVRKIGYKQ